MTSKILFAGATALAAVLALGQPASAFVVTATGTNPDGGAALKASADFTQSGNNLQIVLSNVATSDVTRPSDVLTAIFFSITGVTTLSKSGGSAQLTSGSTVFYDSDGQPAGGDVGGEWAFKSNLQNPPLTNPPTGKAPGGAYFGISSSGLSGTNPATQGIFGPNDRFDTTSSANLAGPDSPDGVQYGLLSKSDDTSTGNSGVLNSGGLIKYSMTFLLSGLPNGFVLTSDKITNVSFQYGTDLNEPNITAVPVPAALPILGAALAGFGVAGFRQRKRAS